MPMQLMSKNAFCSIFVIHSQIKVIRNLPSLGKSESLERANLSG
jgi:hypothetical protein